MREIIKMVKNAIRHPYAWPGGYPIYTVMSEGELLCPECARQNFRQIAEATRDGLRDGWQALGAEAYWEGADQQCAHCGKDLPSAYGDPEKLS